MSFKYCISTKIWTCVSYVFYILDTVTLKKICCMEANYTRVRSCLWWKLNSAIMLETFVALHMSENTRPTHGNFIGAERTRSTKTEKYHWRTKHGRQMRLPSSVKCKCGYSIPSIWPPDMKHWNRRVHQSLVHSIIFQDLREYGQSALDEYWHAHT